MVKVREDLTGRIFGRLKVLEQVEDYIDAKSGQRMAKWLCECSCKDRNIVAVLGQSLKNGNTKSCGCWYKECASNHLREVTKKSNMFSDKLCDEYGEYYVGYTNNTKNMFYVDADDFDKIKNYCWTEYCPKNNGTHTLKAYIDGNNVRMHTFLGYAHYDHIDRNELNNRKYNLRKCTKKDNNRNRSLPSNNTSGAMGVNWERRRNKWRSRIVVDEKEIYLGTFQNKEDAIKARLKAEAKYYGEFAPQRYLFEQYGITQQNDSTEIELIENLTENEDDEI